MSFRAAEAASCTRYWGTILIYNFAVEANRHRRYHRRQPPEKQINFFSSISPLHPARWAAFPKWCMHLLVLMWAVSQISEGWGIDSGDDEEILMHIYQLIKGQSQQASAFSSRPSVTLFLSLSLSTSLMPFPWNPPFSSHTKGFYVSCLSCPGYTCLPPSSSTRPFGSHIYSSGVRRGGEGWGRDADSLLCSVTVK